MNHFHHIVTDKDTLHLFLMSPEIHSNACKARSILVQLFSSQTDRAWIQSIIDTLKEDLPSAVRVGSTSVGEISQGHLHIETTVVSLSFFDEASVIPIAMPCDPGDEVMTGSRLKEAIDNTGSDIAGVLLLATPLTINAGHLLQGMAGKENSYPVFGGGAGVYKSGETSLIFSENDFFSSGVVAVVFAGRDLHIFSRTYLGWQPLSKEMTITKTDGMRVVTVDGESAFDVYYRYLNIPNDKQFFMNALEFPFLLERDGETIARVPFFADQSGAIQFAADLNAGEKFRIGYGNPETIIQDAAGLQGRMREFNPEAIFLYTCICRRFLMQNDVDLETLPFQSISPTTGFYTYGEFYGSSDKLRVFNSTMVAVGMREGKRSIESADTVNNITESIESVSSDPYTNKHTRIVSRLVHFIGVVTSELEAANRELTKISEIDKLTNIFNRLKLDAILEKQIYEAVRYHEEFSVIMMDIDFFKRVNDSYGHNVGDAVLRRMANILRDNVRLSDTVGRWGGEEFLIILPHTNIDQAFTAAEQLRLAMAGEIFPEGIRQTCSFGVAGYIAGNTSDAIVGRADKALYRAKNSGRNRVCRTQELE